ncbi:hypothetical protein AAG570_008172 [Ranatra chinensis]|uniref:Signal recognition particle subunit SRP72 n=1 Tax=Ranatra chinensis TaxID=642074 RepID=A0ABD0XV17_9HEMI
MDFGPFIFLISVLHHFPDDIKAFQYRIVCLINLSRFEDALSSILKFPKFSQVMCFEKAYCQYRLNQTNEALDTLNSADNEPLHLKELRAQVYYRLERFEECLEVYRDIIKSTHDCFDDERQTNLAAVIANICFYGGGVEMPSFPNETYELAYNVACHLIAKGHYLEAERKLKQAEKLCRDSFDEDTPPEEIEEEVAIIKVQQGYCMHKQGREKDAQALYNFVLKQKPNDAGLVAVASNNTAAINGKQYLFHSKKKLKAASTDTAQHKLTSQQRKVIAVNNCLLNTHTSQCDQALEFCDRLISYNPDALEEAMLIKAVVLMRDDKKKAIALLNDFIKQHPQHRLTMSLAMVELLLNEGELNDACKILENLGEDTFKPGIVSAVVTLRLGLGQASEASKILQQAVSWHRKNKTAGDLSALWRQAADLHLRGGQPEDAANSLEELFKINPKDSTTLAQLIIAYAQFNPSKAKSLSTKLPNMVDLTPNIDIETLEASNWLTGLKVIKRAVKGDPSPGTPIVEINKKKKQQRKKRRGKLPKNYDPTRDPDPERWLPKHERSTFRKKKDRRNRDIGKGTQGAATHVSDQFDITKMATSQKGNSQTSPVPDNLKHQQRKIQHKKKKKGVKW